MSDPSYAPQQRFAAWVLVVIGCLMAALCGGCTLTIWVTGLADGSPASQGVLPAVAFLGPLLFGGLPALGGALLAWAGWRDLGRLENASETADPPE